MRRQPLHSLYNVYSVFDFIFHLLFLLSTMCVYVCMYVCMYMCVCMVCMCVCVCVYVYACMHKSNSNGNRKTGIMKDWLLNMAWSKDSDQWEVQWCASKPDEASNSKTTPWFVVLYGVSLEGVNARRHTAPQTVKQIEDFILQVLPCPPYSPDLAPTDFHLFWPLKDVLFGRNLRSETCILRLQDGIDIRILNRHGMWETWRGIRTATFTGSIVRAKRWWNSRTRCHSYVPHLIQNVAAHMFRNTGLSYTDLCLTVIYECHDGWWMCARCNEGLLNDRSASFVILLWRLVWVELYHRGNQHYVNFGWRTPRKRPFEGWYVEC